MPKPIGKTFYVYILTDARGDHTMKVVDQSSDNLTIGGYDADGNYQQYDSYEAYHAYVWAEKHGFKLEAQKHTICVMVGGES